MYSTITATFSSKLEQAKIKAVCVTFKYYRLLQITKPKISVYTAGSMLLCELIR